MQMMPLDLPDPDWIALLREQVDTGRSIAEVAREVGMSRPSLSMLLAGTYPARIDKVSRRYAAQVIALYRTGVPCPHLKRTITAEDCASHAAAQMSTSDHERLRQYVACLRCPLNPRKPVGGPQ